MRYEVVRIIPIFLVALVVTLALATLTQWPDQQATRVLFSQLTNEKPQQNPSSTSARIQKIGDIPSIADADPSAVHIEFISRMQGWLSAGGKLWKTEDGGGKWLLVYDASPKKIWKVRFIEPKVGWMIASNELYRTEDGGSTWAQFPQLPSLPFAGSLSDLKFLKDGRRGWAVGGMYMPISKERLNEKDYPPNRYLSPDSKHELRGAIFYTEDGGETWHKQFLTQGWGILNILFAIDEEHAWAAGTAGRFYIQNRRWKEMDYEGRDQEGATVVKSLDVEIGFPTYQPYCIFFLNASTGWLSNSNGYLAISSDGGKKWKDISPPIGVTKGMPDFFMKHFFTDQMNGWGFGYDRGLYRTKDGGAYWEKQEVEVHFNDVCFLDSSDGWAVAKEGLFHINL